MKIGIMTFWWSEDNYGQQLQCYALQKYLREAGHDAYLIRYDPRSDFIKNPFFVKVLKAFNPVKLIKFLFSRFQLFVKAVSRKKEHSQNPRFFESFRKKHIKQSNKIWYSYAELKKNPPEADVYIVGSDQVWNFGKISLKHIKNVVHAYFLDFGSSNIKRFSYAASWGKKQISDSLKVEVSPLLNNFDWISVREKSGINICSSCDVENSLWVHDPTLFLPAEKYRMLYRNEKIRKPTEKYIFLYYLNNGSKFPINNIYKWAKNKGLNVIYVSGNNQFDKYKKTYATIPEWLYLLDHAEYVFTNSFHCCVFSIIFKKLFAVIPLIGINSEMNERIISLFDLCNIKSRFLKKEDFSVISVPYKAKLSKNELFLNILNKLI
ncbi:MAG: hypothetical protein BKP49_07830 [Treponema sp. CETP13]|nr:MAG: hypothetical protein BKP49_07830 [Treponema sp. CETP13]